jgi:hypothetical protein
MGTFGTPANRDTFADPATLWMGWPMAACAASMDIAARQWAVWAAAQRAALDASARIWGASLTPVDPAPVDERPPAVALAAMDMRDAGAAVLRAQMDAVAAMRRSA